MKRLDLPLWSDTVFIFFVAFLFGFCLLRFYLPLWGAVSAALPAAAGLAALFHVFIRARRRKKHAGEREKREIGKLAFHLAMDSPEHNAALIAKCLTAEHEKQAKKEGGSGSDGAKTPNRRSENVREAAASPYAQVRGGRIDTEDGCTFLRFQFEKVTADELSPVIRAEGEKKTVLAAAFTDEAQKLAASFGLTLKDASAVYSLIKDSGCMPDELIEPPAAKGGFLEKLKFRIRRDAWRGYLFAGAFLLLFSLLTVFPIYYIVSGSLMLAAAVLVRFFGKKE